MSEVLSPAIDGIRRCLAELRPAPFELRDLRLRLRSRRELEFGNARVESFVRSTHNDKREAALADACRFRSQFSNLA